MNLLAYGTQNLELELNKGQGQNVKSSYYF